MNDNRKMIKYVCIAMVVIAIIVISTVISMWTNWGSKKGSKSSKAEKIGAYKSDTNFKQISYEIYKSEVKRLLLPMNTNQLFEQMDPDFLKRYQLNKDNFKSYLEKNNLIGSDIRFSAYNVLQKGDVYLYKMYYFVYKDGINIKNASINLIETKPYVYTLSFEKDAEALLEKEIAVTKENILFNIRLIESQGDSVKYEITFTNKNEQNIQIDFDDINHVNLILNDNSLVRMSSTVISSDDEVIAKGSSLKKEASFLIQTKDQSNIKGIQFEKVKIGEEIKKISISF